MENLNINTGVTGAKKASWKPENPRQFVLQGVELYGPADIEAIRRHVKEHVLDHQGYLDTIVDYYVDNTVHALKKAGFGKSAAQVTAEREAKQERKATAKAATAEVVNDKVDNVIKEEVTKEVKRILMDTQLPDGTRLRDATGAQCTAAGTWMTKEGSWYLRIGATIAPDAVVGSAMTEAGLQAIY